MGLRKTVCGCGYEFATKDIRPPFERAPDKFYGGNVKKFSYATCECGKKYKLYIRPQGHTWVVVDVELIEKSYICQYCGRELSNALGLASHERACKNK
jgi:hypothetical protein